MNDTIWIARSKKDMLKILEESKVFYRANDSQVNGEKSVLITINNLDKNPAIVTVGPNKEPVIELDRKCCTRFLGIWLDSKEHTKDTIKRAAKEVALIYNVINTKWI